MITEAVMPYVIAGAVAFAGVAGWKLYATGKDRGKAEIQAQWAEANQKALLKREALSREYADKEAKLQTEITLMQQEAADEKAKLINIVNRLRSELRLRPQRSVANVSGNTPMPQNTTTNADEQRGKGCSPDELYADSAEMVVWLGSEADRLRILLRECRSIVDEFRK